MANKLEDKNLKFQTGDTVAVHQIIKEADKTRTQIFKGVVIAIKGRGETKTFTVRKIGAGNIGIERIWPVNSPWIEKIEVLQKGSFRRAKLYFLREKTGRQVAKIK